MQVFLSACADLVTSVLEENMTLNIGARCLGSMEPSPACMPEAGEGKSFQSRPLFTTPFGGSSGGVKPLSPGRNVQGNRHYDLPGLCF